MLNFTPQNTSLPLAILMLQMFYFLLTAKELPLTHFILSAVENTNTLMEWKWEKLDQSGISIKTKPNGEIIRIGPQFWKDFDKYDLLKSVKKINCPILFIHGSKDERVPIYEMEAYFESVYDPKEKIIIKGADHGFVPHRDKMYRIVIDWFKNYLA